MIMHPTVRRRADHLGNSVVMLLAAAEGARPGDVTDVAREIERLERAGLKFRNEMETGPGGRQIQLEDPDGNPIELFEPARR